MKRWAIIAVLVFSVIGAAIAGISTSQHMRLEREGFSEPSFCTINEYINCDLVNVSSYSTFLGVPVAWFGVMFFASLVVLMLLSLRADEKTRPHVNYALLLALLGLVFDARMAYVSFYILQLLCLECLGMYLMNLLIVLFLFLALPQNPLRIFSFLKKSFSDLASVLRHAAVVLVFFVIGALVMSQVQAGQKKGVDAASVAEKLEVFHSSQPYDIQVNDTWPVWGNPKAKVVIVKFADFQCPHCAVAALQIPPYLHEFRNDVQLRYVHFPLPFHPIAKLGSQASVCAQAQGKFWEYQEVLYRHQLELNRDFFLAEAEKMGFARADFEKCMDAPETVARVDEDLALAKKLHIEGAPALFVNGKSVRYWPDGKLWQAILKEELKK